MTLQAQINAANGTGYGPSPCEIRSHGSRLVSTSAVAVITRRQFVRELWIADQVSEIRVTPSRRPAFRRSNPFAVAGR